MWAPASSRGRLAGVGDADHSSGTGYIPPGTRKSSDPGIESGVPAGSELAKYFLAELLSEPSQTENEALESEDLSRGAEQDEVRLELERSANSNPALAPRERKAGCKNFFWKTFTSC
ncbi:PREDICTED: somatostatin [Chaetura pelagica]|uniref:somatostatin n=1 Tax=Chaetura pelagica TaxID=8897 RepID=UPI0005232482|nr:PREDICTED: somatostatin [Chaetura pelagica]